MAGRSTRKRCKGALSSAHFVIGRPVGTRSPGCYQVRRGHRTLQQKGNPPSGWLERIKMLGGVPPLPVKMRSNLESSRGETI